MLTAAAIEAAAVPFGGWVANRLDPECEEADELVAALRQRLAAPFVGELDFSADDRSTADQLRHMRLESFSPPGA
jgi:dethiobiotin synthetase